VQAKKKRGEIPRKSLTQDNPLMWNPAPSFDHLDYSPEKARGLLSSGWNL
jgi:hypothetical protein